MESTRGKPKMEGAGIAVRSPKAPATRTAPHGLGATIRDSRKAAGMTLQQLAEHSKLSVSYLSQLERNILTPSISTLKRIADLLRIPAGELMFGADASAASGVGVVRKDLRKRLSFPGSQIEYELLTPDLRRRASLLWLVAPPGSESGPAFVHDGEDGVVVLKGELQVEIGSVSHRLGPGDSVYFDASIPHCWRNVGDEAVEAIWLSTPPSF